jgi:hypothetical protein
MLDCRDYPRPEDPNELETILHFICFIEFMVAIQPSFNAHADNALDGPQELHISYMQLVETRRRCRNLLRLLDDHYALYSHTDEGCQSPKSVIQWARDMMAGTGTELKQNIKLAQKQRRKIFNPCMKRPIMLSNLDRVMETWHLKMGNRTGWWGSVHWKAQDFLVKYSPYSYSDGSDVPPLGWIKGDGIFEGALAMATAMRNPAGDSQDNDGEEEEEEEEEAGEEDGGSGGTESESESELSPEEEEAS